LISCSADDVTTMVQSGVWHEFDDSRVLLSIRDLCKDPPFSRMDLVSCRNVLIYLGSQAKERVIQALHFALKPQRYLLLGTSETLGSHLFSLVSKPARLYQKVGATRPVLVPGKEGQWEVAEMSTFATVAMAGNQPKLPDDTRSRTIRVLLMPDWSGRAEDSDWELIDAEGVGPAHALQRQAGAHLGVTIGGPERPGNGDEKMDQQDDGADA
jgi:hypothetical protein